MNKRLLGLTLAISAVLASTNISFATDSRITNTGEIDTINGKTFENIDISSQGDTQNGYGSGVYNTGTINSITNNTYSGNTAFNGGGLYNSGLINAIENAVFSNNTALQNGGAIYNTLTAPQEVSGIQNLYSANFINNSATLGGAIYNAKDGYIGIIGDINFTDNKANVGGAIYNENSGWINSDFSNITFKNNKANNVGGAIYNDGAIGLGDDIDENNNYYTIFENNTAGNAGGAIFNTKHSNLDLTNVDFINNSTTEENGTGGAIVNSGQASIKNSRFTGNSAYHEKTVQDENQKESIVKSGAGGAIQNLGGDFVVDNTTFTENKAGEYGGAIFHAGTGTVTASTFNKNSSTNGGAIALRGASEDKNATLNISESTFEANSAENGGALYNGLYSSLDVANSKFTNNTATKSGGAIYNEGSVKSIKGSSFVGNSAFSQTKSTTSNSNDYNGVTISTNSTYISNDGSGGAIYNKNGDLNISDSTFENNKAAYGGAIFVETDSNGTLNISNSKFINNTSYNESTDKGTLNVDGQEYSWNNEHNGLGTGGAIASYTDTTIENSEFTENTTGEDGGAIYTKGNLTIKNSTFKNNIAKSDSSGTNYNYDYEKGEVLKEDYDSHDGYGGAISHNGDNLTIENSTFEGNIAGGEGGGAIDTEAKVANITGSNFNSNSTSDIGGAISTSNTKLNIDSSKFDSNTAAQGGAIYSMSYDPGIEEDYLGSINIQNSTFTNNKAEVNGGAIASGLNIIGTDENYPENPGETSSVNLGNITITDTDFTNNSASKYGGAIYYSQAKNWGGNPTLTINAQNKDVTFSGNTAEKGNDIYINNVTTNLNAADGRKITLNGGIAGNGTINTTGSIMLNGAVTPDNGALAVNANSGTIKLALENYLDGTDLTLAEGSTLDLRNSQLGVMKLNSLTSNNGNLKLDVDVTSDVLADSILANTASGTLNLSEVNMMSDMADDTNSISATLTGLDNLQIKTPENGLDVLTNDYLYTVKINGTNATVDRYTENGEAVKIDGFTLAVNQTDKIGEHNINLQDERSFSAQHDIEITGSGLEKGWTGNLSGTKLSVNGNGYTIKGGENSGIIVNNGQTLEFTDANIDGFKTSEDAKGALTVKNGGNLNIAALNNDITISNVTAGQATDGSALNANAIYLDGEGNSKVNLTTQNSKSITINNDIRSTNAANEITMKGDGTITYNGIVDPVTLTNENARTIHNNKIQDVTYNLNSGMVGFSNDNYLSNGNNSLVFNGGMLTVANGAVNPINLEALSLNANSNIAVDADLANSKMDTISANTYSFANDDVKLNVNGINLLSDAKTDNTIINFVNDDSLKSHISTTVSEVAYSPLYKYGVAYDPTQGNFEFTRGSSSDYKNINPAVMVAPVAAQLGGYFNQLNAYDQAFSNMDMTMLMTREQRQALKMYNKYAYNGDGLGSVASSSGVIPEERAGVWARPYSSFENVHLKNGPKVSNVMYGTFFGGDTSIKEFRNGFDGVFSAYVGYNGSHQVFNHNSLWQNGGTLGLTGTLYKGNWFGGWTIASGLSGVDANTMYGSEDFGMWSIGTALKTGYNWELFNSKFIIQPHMMISYSLVDTFNYTNAAGLRINSDPLNAIQLAPGLRFVGNLKDGWQPYLGVDFMWNIMDKTKFDAVETSLPQLSVKPYIQYGIGVQKRWGERSTGYAQAMFRNIGRNGVIFSLGYRAAFGHGH